MILHPRLREGREQLTVKIEQRTSTGDRYNAPSSSGLQGVAGWTKTQIEWTTKMVRLTDSILCLHEMREYCPITRL